MDRQKADGLRSSCIDCDRAYLQGRKVEIGERRRAKYQEDKDVISRSRRSYYTENKAAITKKRLAYRESGRQRDSHYRRKYGISLNAYDELSANQLGLCLICCERGGARTLVVDHCHRTGVVRGLLCSKCNTAIGLLGDDHKTILAAAAYVERASPALVQSECRGEVEIEK